MDLDSLSPAELLAAHLALIVAVLHLSVGMANWIRWLSVGFLVPRDVRWPLFVLSAIAIVLVMPFAARDRFRRPIYAAGIVLMAVYVVGYFAWHALGHRPLFFVGGGTFPDGHGALVPFVLDHLFAGTVEFVAIAAEVSLALVLAYLLVAESRQRDESEDAGSPGAQNHQ